MTEWNHASASAIAADLALGSGSDGSGVWRTATEPSIMQDVAKAMQHICASETCAGASQMLRQEDTGHRRAARCTISFRVVFFSIAGFVMTFVAQFFFVHYYLTDHMVAWEDLSVSVRAIRQDLASRTPNFDDLASATDKILAKVEAYDTSVHSHLSATLYIVRGTYLAVLILATVGAIIVGIFVSRELKHMSNLSNLMDLRRITNLGKSDISTVPAGAMQRSCIRELQALQDSFDHLALGVDRFARFVPESVVRRIVEGEHRAARLHVDRKEVTIMFSDIEDFTAISEQLSKSNARYLLFMLTRYFTVMSHIIEMYEGSVGEILGDGILAFWNTPNAVVRHQAKASMAAVVMQQALKFLNAEYDMLGLPNVKIRVGIHTGCVLTGNIGSFKKMKFGCIGDPMNVAARLEGLCKVYCVNIICSSKCHKALVRADGFISRQLDYVQVKGRQTPMKIFEIMGADTSQEPGDPTGMPDMTGVLSEAIGGLSTDCESAKKLIAATRWNGRSRYPTSASTDAADEEDLDEQSVRHLPTVRTSRMDCVSPRRRSLSQTYEHALDAFQSGRFEDSRCLSQTILREVPDDVPSAKLLARSDSCLKEGIVKDLSNWKGVAVMTEK